jgi:D-alanyl-D-alanine dipeptidase
VPIIGTDELVAYQLREEMLPITGETIYVRQTVRDMLGEVSLRLAADMPGTQLQVGYGYRALSIQRANFKKQQDRLRGTVPDNELDAAVHRYIAIPEIAAHPAGAAVDARMLRDGQPVDCGTDMWQFVPDTYTFSPFISRQARDNRLRLRLAMTAVGFAPFDGEWWHFSYGDKEWAAYYDRQAAVYEQVEFSTQQ